MVFDDSIHAFIIDVKNSKIVPGLARLDRSIDQVVELNRKTGISTKVWQSFRGS